MYSDSVMNPRDAQYDSNALLESNVNESTLLSEFKANLAQQTFGIARYHFKQSTLTHVVAEITLTDGQLCTIDLSSRGYEVRYRCYVDSSVSEFTIDVQILSLSGSKGTTAPESYEVAKYPIFESLDSLLRTISLEYKSTWDKTLLDRLSALRDG